MYIMTKPDYIQSASEDIQLCSYFSLFIAIPSSHDSCSNTLWSREEILDSDFVQETVNKFVPKGIGVKVDCWRIHISIDEVLITKKSHHSTVKQSAVEYRVRCFGEFIPIRSIDAEEIKRQIEGEVQIMSPSTRKGAWNVSNVIPRRFL